MQLFFAPFFGTRTLQAKNVSALSRHRIIVERRASYSVRAFTALRFSLPWLIGISGHLACACAAPARVCNASVYDVSSRESFEALPRWLEELENYVPPEVVKIVVGNKLDKVSKVTNDSLITIVLSAGHSRMAPFRNTLDRCPHQRAQRSQRGRDVYLSKRPPRRLRV
jgi:hypothetical protein